mmetsp:Transcript_51071/g.51484  ORF Transcript_51071/g.51484 Transcript_51071/m.51484 type:complete len:91 (-) Transcript_51071:815-1087(-)
MKLDASRDYAVETLLPVHDNTPNRHTEDPKVNHAPVEMDDGLGKPVLESVVPTETKEDHVDTATKPKNMDSESSTTINIPNSSSKHPLKR